MENRSAASRWKPIMQSAKQLLSSVFDFAQSSSQPFRHKRRISIRICHLLVIQATGVCGLELLAGILGNRALLHQNLWTLLAGHSAAYAPALYLLIVSDSFVYLFTKKFWPWNPKRLKVHPPLNFGGFIRHRTLADWFAAELWRPKLAGNISGLSGLEALNIWNT